MPALPRICSKTKFNVEAQVTRPLNIKARLALLLGIIYEVCGAICVDYTAAIQLGKEGHRQFINLKGQLSHEQDVARHEVLMNQIAPLLQGTLNLGKIVYSNRFVLVTAESLKMADDSFTTEQSIDFILRCFVEGFVRGRGQPLTEAQRQEYFQSLDTEAFHLYWQTFAVFHVIHA